MTPEQPAIQQPKAFQTGERSLRLQANEGTEIKRQMRAGERYIFSWVGEGGLVSFDRHSEKPNEGEHFTSDWRHREKSESHGEFTAPVDGAHLWYWNNKSAAPVTVTVKMSGHFEKLYRPQ